MKKFLIAATLAAFGTAATAQTLAPQPEVAQNAPSFISGAGFGAMGGTEGIIAGVLFLVVVGALASGEGNNGTTTVFR